MQIVHVAVAVAVQVHDYVNVHVVVNVTPGQCEPSQRPNLSISPTTPP
jgi:hypothetical protein